MDHMKMLCDIGELSQIFADSLSIKAFLQKIVVMVAKHMEADVCSIYLFDDGRQELTLKATEGLNPIAIGKVKLKLGEGLAGLALKELRPICEMIGSQHPNFKFFPGIFEERYESFLAVPILRGILKIGVLVVQREKKNPFTEPDSMALRVVTSQLANIIENARLLTTLQVKHEEKIDDSFLHTQKIIKGKVASEGFALANVFILDQEKALDSFIRKDLDGSTYTPDDFRQAVAATEQQLKALQQQVEEKLSDVASLIFTAHLLMLKDKQFAGAMTRRIEKGESPPAVILSIAQKYIEIFSHSKYLDEIILIN